MPFLDAIVLGVVQGLTEFIPVSSSGHLILIRELFNLSDENGLAIDAVLQLATALAIIVYFVRSWMGFLRDKNLLISVIVATVPAVIFGLLLESKMETVFRSSSFVASMLIIGAVLMWGAEIFAKQNLEINPKRSLVVGLFQALALVPGISRSGATISGGLFSGLTREGATRFSFLLALPIIAGSGLKKLIELGSSGILVDIGPSLVVGSIFAFVSGLWAIHFLINYLKNHKLTIFIWYRVALAVLILFFL